MLTIESAGAQITHISATIGGAIRRQSPTN
jgi:hypothetical protein